jgi:hypothetical protein
MEHEDRRLGEAMRIVLEGDADPLWESAARSLLASVRRDESEMALRQQVSHIQQRLTDRVTDAQCQRVVALAKEVANASRS